MFGKTSEEKQNFRNIYNRDIQDLFRETLVFRGRYSGDPQAQISCSEAVNIILMMTFIGMFYFLPGLCEYSALGSLPVSITNNKILFFTDMRIFCISKSSKSYIPFLHSNDQAFNAESFCEQSDSVESVPQMSKVCRLLIGIDERIKNNEMFLGEIGCEFKTIRPVLLKGFECSVNEFCADSGKSSS